MKSTIISLLQSKYLFLLSLITATPTWAQVVSDNTTLTTVTTPDGNNFTINDGDRAGGNLFHSFQDFSVPINGSAFFNNALDINNIISRVTGGNISNIDGLIRANGNANLFLINPAGIIFGAGARLDIGGSFLGSTADSLLFPEGEFSATDLDNPPLLTINAPIGLNFRDNPRDIVNQSVANEGVGLEVSSEESLTLVGGDINLAGGNIFAPGGRVELGGLSVAGEISINTDGSLIFPEDRARGNVNLTNSAEVNVSAGGGGSIAVNASNINLDGAFGGTRLRAGIATDSGSPTAQAGDIILNATHNINVSQGSSIINRVATTGVGNAGEINITTTNLFLTQGGEISSGTFGLGNGGAITIDATDTISADGAITINDIDSISANGAPPPQFLSGIFSIVRESGMGNAGGINISTTNLSLTQGGEVNASTVGQGDAGVVTINASGTISAEGASPLGFPSGIFSVVGSSGTGNSGGVNITTTNLFLTQGSAVNANTFGQGNAGAITINALGTISAEGESLFGFRSGIASLVGESGVGNSNGINITTTNLSLIQGDAISASTLGQGNTGTITINASGTMNLSHY